MTGTLLDRLVERTAAASPVWARAVVPAGQRDGRAVFGPLSGAGFAEGMETIYEGYLVHHAAGRVLRPGDRDGAILLGDYLYAAGLVEICRAEDVDAVRILAALVSLASHGRAEALDPADDGRLWLAAARTLGGRRDGSWSEACEALRRHDVGPLRRLAANDEDGGARVALHVALLRAAEGGHE